MYGIIIMKERCINKTNTLFYQFMKKMEESNLIINLIMVIFNQYPNNKSLLKRLIGLSVARLN